MTNQDGLLAAYILNGSGGGTALSWAQLENWTAADGPLWVHLDRTEDRAIEWVTETSGIDAISAETLLRTEGNRPRVHRIGNSLILALRGINRVEGETNEDMPTMHIWADADKVVTLRRRSLAAGQQLADEISQGHGPVRLDDLLVRLTVLLIDPIIPIVSDLDDAIDALQQEVLTAHGASLRQRLQAARQDAINLRRHIAPQRDALSRFYGEQVDWMSNTNRARLREITDYTARYVEDLDAARERAAVAQDELNNQLTERMNKTMYFLAIVSAILLPASLLTGLFGINVGGMPGVENNAAFWVIAIGIPVMAIVEYWLLRKLKWI